MNARQERGKQIAQTCRIEKTAKGWVVPSQSGQGTYLVYTKSLLSAPECTCPDFELRKNVCKHIYAVEITLKKEIDQQGNVTITQTKRVTYSQDWSAYDKAKTQEKGLFQKMLKELCNGIPNTEYSFGRPTMPLADMVFSSALKVYSTFSLRRFTEDAKMAQEKGHIEKVPHYSTVALYFENPELTPLLVNLIEKSAMPLKEVETDFAVDSSGFSTSRFDRWYSFKHGKQLSVRKWIKAHLMCGVKTNVVTAVKLTTQDGADCPQFKELLNTTSQKFRINEVSGDKAYLSRENLEAVASVGGMAYVPFKSNSTGKKRGSELWSRMYHYFMYNREEFLSHYHKRSNVETTFHMIKSKFGDAVRSKTETAQVNEVLLKILCHNICVVIQEMFELGIEAKFG